MAACLGRRHVSVAACLGDTCCLLPGPHPACTCHHPQRRQVSVTSGGACRLGQRRHVGVAHAAWAIADTLPCWFPTQTALIPTLTALIPRRESSWLCDDSLHVIWNLCYFHLSIRCFETLFRRVSILELSRDRTRRPLLLQRINWTALPLKGNNLAHAACLLIPLIHSSISRSSLLLSPLSSLMSWA
jgi:hypothetical protein